MSDIVLRVENLSKQYRLGVIGSGTLRDDLSRWIARARGKENPTLKVGETNTLDKIDSEYVWALQDINFEVKQGEVLGIIGKNGAGKSTLLKILSKVTGPTKGSIKAKGRIASLLEVGTGMHPELTGRENIFLNGAILGMTKAEVRKKLDEIIDFAGIAKYVDTPIKRYSSGMSVRLGFAVAAFLEPEILIVDEVLAVGDAEFQKKAIGKMQDVSQGEGRTVLFVSHNMGSVKNLCSKAIILKKGEVLFMGDTSDSIDLYLKDNISNNGKDFKNGINVTKINQCSIDGFTVKSISIYNPKSLQSVFKSGDALQIDIEYETSKKFIAPAIVIQLKDEQGIELLRLSNMPISGFEISNLFSEGRVSIKIDELLLVKGTYFIDFGFVRERVEWYFKVENLIKVDIIDSDFYGSGLEMDRKRGLIIARHTWKHDKI